MRSLLFAMSLAALSVSGATPPHPAAPAAPHTVPQLDALFGQLAKAGTDEEAKPLEDEILALFLESGSASTDLLMTRAATALAGGDMDTAQQLLAVVTKVAPDYAEGWHQRGKLQALAGDDEGAIVSLQKSVTLNPRQFAAMTELGGILVEYGDKRDALKMLRKVQSLDPHFSGVDREVRQLAREVEGDRI
jgi:Flp pilus assembly protein TadD